MPQPTEPTTPIIIRGKEYLFTVMQKRIIDAVLNDNHRIRDIIAFLQNGEVWADESEFKTKILPALDSLCALLIEGEPLLRKRGHLRDEGFRHIEYFLPEGATLSYAPRKGQTFLRFTDASTSTPNFDKQQRRRRQSIGTPDEPPQAAIVPAAKAKITAEVHRAPVVQSILEGSMLTTPQGTVVKLEPYPRKVLELFRSGKRYLVSEIVVALGGESDNTINNVVSTELFELQKLLGPDVLRRKQKPGQPARWWLVEDSLVYVTPKETS